MLQIQSSPCPSNVLISEEDINHNLSTLPLFSGITNEYELFVSSIAVPSSPKMFEYRSERVLPVIIEYIGLLIETPILSINPPFPAFVRYSRISLNP